MTEEQKTCGYCHFENFGLDFASEDNCNIYFQLGERNGHYYINAWSKNYWSGEPSENFDVDSEEIHYCPMCGRKLGKGE